MRKELSELLEIAKRAAGLAAAVHRLDAGDRQANFVIKGSAAFVRFNLGGY